jgi:hypothetical protein
LEVSGQLHAPAALPRERAPGDHWIGGWVDLTAGLDDLEKKKFLTLLGLELRPLGSPARPVAIPTTLSRLMSRQKKKKKVRPPLLMIQLGNKVLKTWRRNELK